MNRKKSKRLLSLNPETIRYLERDRLAMVIAGVQTDDADRSNPQSNNRCPTSR